MIFNRKNIAPYINSGSKVISGAVVSILLLINISNELRGVFYAMQSLLAAQILFDGGMSLVLLKRTSRVIRNNRSQPGRYSEKRINLYLKFLKLWGRCSFLLYTVIVTSLGYIYLNSAIGSRIGINWEFPWVLASIFSGAMFVIRPKQIFLESSLDIDFVQFSSAIITLTSLGVLAAMIFLGFALYGLAAYYFIMVVASYFILKARHANIIKIAVKEEMLKVKFIKKFLASQTKMFITYSIGFFYWNSLSLIIFKFLGPEVAGKWGVVNSMLSGISQLSNSRVVANISLHATSLSATRNHATVFFEKMMATSAVMFCALSIFLGVILYYLSSYVFNISSRITGEFEYWLMLAVFLINMIIGNYALAGRLVRNEPYFKFSLVTNILTPLLLLATVSINKNLVVLLFLSFAIHASYIIWARLIYLNIFKKD